MSLSAKALLFICFQLLVFQETGLAQLRNEVVDGDTILIFTQPMRDKFEETVSATVSNTDSSLIYDYKILSSSKSEQNIWFWMIITDADFLESTSPPGWRFINRARNPKRVSWGAQSDSAKIHPSTSKTGFSLNSKGRPSIKNYYMEGWMQVILQNGQEPDSIENSSFFDIAKKGTTIFPMAVVIEDFLDFTDTLETFRHRSCTELGWATDAGVCDELEDDLSEVRAALVAGDSLSAANALAEFIALVEAEQDASLTSEGYALLYFNAEYLRRRLKKVTN